MGGDFQVDAGDIVFDPEVECNILELSPDDEVEVSPDDEILRPEEYNEIIKSRGR